MTVAFVSFRFSGTDGVSLETRKWAEVFARWGWRCVYFGGELDTPAEDSCLVEEAHFRHPAIAEIYRECFGRTERPPALTRRIHEYRELLKKRLHDFVRSFDVDVLIPENAVTIPLNIPLSLAITELIAETGIPTIAHHHDFFWERKRFLRNCVWDYFAAAFPPHLPSVHHVVINTSGQNQLALRTGIAASLIPNVMNFEVPPPPPDDYARDVRRDLELADGELLILQPTRVVQRKGIEHAIELVSRLQLPATLVISHASGDEGFEYEQRVRDYAKLLGIKALFIQKIMGERRGRTPEGRKIYALSDIYPHADLVTYPSLSEGFGNAFLEAIYFRRPILVNNYSIYFYDIKPKGFRVLEMDDFVSEQTVADARDLLLHPERVPAMAEHNYRLCLKHYSYGVLEAALRGILARFWGERLADHGERALPSR